MRSFFTRCTMSAADRAAIWLSIWISVGYGIYCLGLNLGPKEGLIFPATTSMVITETKQVGPFSTAICGYFRKHGNDSYRGIRWKLAGPGRETPFEVEYRKAEDRGEGDHAFGPWILPVLPEELEKVHATALHHRGGWRWWLVETPLYPAAKNGWNIPEKYEGEISCSLK